MASNLSKADALTPLITFISMIVLGVVISEFIIENESLQLPIILFSLFAGIVVAALEMRALIHRRKVEKAAKTPKSTDEDSKKRLARYVADLFDEDIPFDEIEAEEEARKKRLEELSNDEKPSDTDTGNLEK